MTYRCSQCNSPITSSRATPTDDVVLLTLICDAPDCGFSEVVSVAYQASRGLPAKGAGPGVTVLTGERHPSWRSPISGRACA